MVTGRLPGPERRRQLLAVARAVFAERGFHETTMADVANEAGVTKPVLYQHFTSKRDMYRTLLDDIGTEIQERVIRAAAEAESSQQRVEAGIEAFVSYVQSEQDGFKVLFSGINRQDEEWVAVIVDVEESICTAIVALFGSYDMTVDRRRTMARGIIGLTETMVRYAWFDHDLDLDPKQLSADIIDLIWGGVSAIGSSGTDGA